MSDFVQQRHPVWVIAGITKDKKIIMACSNCGYETAENSLPLKCPKCGRPMTEL